MPSHRTSPVDHPSDNLKIRWIEGDAAVAAAEVSQVLGCDAWTPERFLEFAAIRDHTPWIGLAGGRVVACLAFSRETDRLLRIHVLAGLVGPQGRYDELMLRHLVGYLPRTRRTAIAVYVRENDLATQLFYRREKFQWVKTVANHFEDGESAYLLRYGK